MKRARVPVVSSFVLSSIGVAVLTASCGAPPAPVAPTPVASSAGQLILRGTADVLGAVFSVDFSVRVTPSGALVVSPDVPFGGVATITAFSDPAVRVTGVSAVAVNGGFTVRATGTLN